MVISWPKGIKPDRIPRSQFHHVNDIAPTIYEIVGIKPPKVVRSMVWALAYTFSDAKAPSRKKVQYFDNNGSRAIYQDGWIAATFGPLVPWLPGAPGLAQWDSAKDKWELYQITKDFSEADNLAGKEPKRLADLQNVFDVQAKANKVYPLGAGIWLRLHPEDRLKSPYTSWRFDATTTRMPEFSAPGLGRENSTVTIDAEIGENASGVFYALGGAGGGLTLYMDKGDLIYEYNLMIIECYTARSASKLAPGKRRIEVTTQIQSPKPLSPAEVVLKVDGQEIARTTVKCTVPALFSASETFDVGVDLGSTVSLDYFDRRPFKFDGKIEKVEVKLNWTHLWRYPPEIGETDGIYLTRRGAIPALAHARRSFFDARFDRAHCLQAWQSARWHRKSAQSSASQGNQHLRLDGVITLIMWPIAMVWAYLNAAAGPAAEGSGSEASSQSLAGKLRQASQRLAEIEASLSKTTVRGA
jgi:hypothetical protein